MICERGRKASFWTHLSVHDDDPRIEAVLVLNTFGGRFSHPSSDIELK